MKYIKKIFIFMAKVLQFLLWHLPISFLAIVGLYFIYKIIIYPSFDIFSITNYAFAIVAALSALSFNYEKSFKGDPAKKDLLRYCGERFLHSSILFLVASVLKYFLMQKDILLMSNNSIMFHYLFVIFQIFHGILFLGSFVNAIAAMRELNAILFEQKKPFGELRRLI